jgi:hypothetical protein
MQYVEHVEQHGKALFEKVCKMDLEGIVASIATDLTSRNPSKRRGSRSKTGTTLRWKVGRSYLSANATKSLPRAGMAVIWLARKWSKNMRVENPSPSGSTMSLMYARPSGV